LVLRCEGHASKMYCKALRQEAKTQRQQATGMK